MQLANWISFLKKWGATMNLVETKGILLFSKDQRKDKLVKIFTESAGKQMFYVRCPSENNPWHQRCSPILKPPYMGNHQNGRLVLLNNAKDIHPFVRSKVIFLLLVMQPTYWIWLILLFDRVRDPHLYQFLHEALQLMDQENDAEIITNILRSRFCTVSGSPWIGPIVRSLRKTDGFV